MFSTHDSIQRDQLEMITLDQLAPSNHLVRKMEAIDFTFIYDLVKAQTATVLYGERLSMRNANK